MCDMIWDYVPYVVQERIKSDHCWDSLYATVTNHITVLNLLQPLSRYICLLYEYREYKIFIMLLFSLSVSSSSIFVSDFSCTYAKYIIKPHRTNFNAPYLSIAVLDEANGWYPKDVIIMTILFFKFQSAFWRFNLRIKYYRSWSVYV